MNSQATMTPSDPKDYTTIYRCSFGHQNDLYMILRRNEENRITTFKGSTWNLCNTCNDGPNLVQRMKAALNIYEQWLGGGVINREEYHRLTNSAVTRDTTRPGSAIKEILTRFEELTSAIEVRASYDHTMKKAEPRKRLMELKRDLTKMRINLHQWATRGGFIKEGERKVPGRTNSQIV